MKSYNLSNLNSKRAFVFSALINDDADLVKTLAKTLSDSAIDEIITILSDEGYSFNNSIYL